jgi:hypothetical protein
MNNNVEKKKKNKNMYLNTTVIAPDTIKIYLPHLAEPINAKKVKKLYPEFAKMFDGKSYENTLLYYYKLNKNEYALEFEDEEAEAEVAEILNVKIIEEDLIFEEEKEGMLDIPCLDKEEVNNFKSELDYMRSKIKENNEKTIDHIPDVDFSEDD